MNKEEILFQVMVPIYNVEPYLEECIQSVLNQTYGNFRLILLDDGSPDRCGEICDNYAAKDPRITVYHKPNGGLMQTRRFGIEKAGKDGYAVFLDGDDSLRSHALETIAKAIEKYRCDCVIYGAEQMLNGEPVFRLDSLLEEEVLVTDKRELLNIVLCRSFNAIWRKSVRMELLAGWDFSPYYHISIGEDRLQSLEIYENAKSICFISSVLYNYRVNPRSMMQTLYENYRVDYTIQEVELDFLRRLGIFSEEDFSRYHSALIDELIRVVVGITESALTRDHKICIFEEIKATNYWRSFLSACRPQKISSKPLEIVFGAFKAGRYSEIFFLVDAYRRFCRLIGRA